MLEKCRVDIVIPVYNDQEGLNRCLDALGKQLTDMATFSVLVVDNGSINKVEITDPQPFKVTVIHCEKPGSYAARNAGANASDADVLVFLDADCEPESGWLERGVSALLDAGLDRAVGGDVLFRISERPTATEAYQHIVGFGQQDNIERRAFTATANLFVKRSVFFKVGPFNESLLSGGDREWCWRAAGAGVPIVFEKAAVVTTLPRRGLNGAVVQARRIAGGRLSLLSENSVGRINSERVLPESSLRNKIRVITTSRQFGSFMKFRVLLVAATLLIIRKIEVWRLKLGGKKERR